MLKTVVQLRLAEAKEKKMKVVYCDETLVTKNSISDSSWSRKRSNIEIDCEKVYTGYVSIIAAVSAEKGLELIKLHDKPIYKFSFSVYLNELSRVNDR